MRKALFGFLALLLSAGVAMAYDQPVDPGLVEHGGSSAAEGVKVYRLVRNPVVLANTGSFSSGEVVVWDTVSDDNVTVNYPSRVGITGSSDAVAGVVVGTIPTADSTGTAVTDLGKRNWGYIQIYGKALASVDGTGITVGRGLRASQFDGAFVAAETTDSGGVAFAYDTTTTGQIEVFVRNR